MPPGCSTPGCGSAGCSTSARAIARRAIRPKQFELCLHVANSAKLGYRLNSTSVVSNFRNQWYGLSKKTLSGSSTGNVPFTFLDVAPQQLHTMLAGTSLCEESWAKATVPPSAPTLRDFKFSIGSQSQISKCNLRNPAIPTKKCKTQRRQPQ